MFFKNLVLLLILNELTIIINCGKCPPKEVSHPCICESQTIKCEGNQSIDLKIIFQNISKCLNKTEKNFNFFVLNNNAIEEIEDNAFSDITFRFIDIIDANSLRKISSHAFNGTANTVEVFEQSGETSLKNTEELFNAINTMENVISITLNIYELKTLPSFAFYNLNRLQEFNLINGQLNTISENGLNFEKISNESLIIDLTNNNLTEYSFNNYSFSGVKRPLEIDLRENYLNFLDENIFKPLLLSDTRNSLNLRANPLKCFDCRMKWLVDYKHIFNEQVIEARCAHFVSIFELELTDFKQC